MVMKGNSVAGICPNPYCANPRGGMRSPTAAEASRFLNELDERFRDKLERGEVDLQVCTICGTWAADIWDTEQRTTVRQHIASPFKFNTGDRVQVTLEGKHCGMVGTITRRMRWSKTVMPPPPPENIYYLVFEGDSTEYGYGEANLTSADTEGDH